MVRVAVNTAAQVIGLLEVMGWVQVGSHNLLLHDGNEFSGLKVGTCVIVFVIMHPCIDPERIQGVDL